MDYAKAPLLTNYSEIRESLCDIPLQEGGLQQSDSPKKNCCTRKAWAVCAVVTLLVILGKELTAAHLKFRAVSIQCMLGLTAFFWVFAKLNFIMTCALLCMQ